MFCSNGFRRGGQIKPCPLNGTGIALGAACEPLFRFVKVAGRAKRVASGLIARADPLGRLLCAGRSRSIQ